MKNAQVFKAQTFDALGLYLTHLYLDVILQMWYICSAIKSLSHHEQATNS
jgi:hypothetical protein